MRIIAHRKNTIHELMSTPTHLGIEIDIRSLGGRLILQHEPFLDGEDFTHWVRAYQHGILIVNVKEEGLETRIIETLSGANIEEFFFLDQSFPMLVKTMTRGERRCAVRVSEFESVETALTLSGKVDWVWVDCFSRFPLSASDAKHLTEAGFKLCIVSPELQGPVDVQAIPRLCATLKEQGIQPHAVCTKVPERWRP